STTRVPGAVASGPVAGAVMRPFLPAGPDVTAAGRRVWHVSAGRPGAHAASRAVSSASCASDAVSGGRRCVRPLRTGGWRPAAPAGGRRARRPPGPGATVPSRRARARPRGPAAGCPAGTSPRGRPDCRRAPRPPAAASPTPAPGAAAGAATPAAGSGRSPPPPGRPGPLWRPRVRRPPGVRRRAPAPPTPPAAAATRPPATTRGTAARTGRRRRRRRRTPAAPPAAGRARTPARPGAGPAGSATRPRPPPPVPRTTTVEHRGRGGRRRRPRPRTRGWTPRWPADPTSRRGTARIPARAPWSRYRPAEPSHQCAAAVEHERLTGDPAGLLRQQERHGGGDVLGLAQPPQRVPVEDLGLPSLVQCAGEPGAHDRGGDRVDPYRGGELEGELGGQVAQRGLAHAVAADAGC